MKVIGYCRVSTREQDFAIQEDSIKKLCEYRKFDLQNIFFDKASGKNTEREGFQRMLTTLKNNTGGIEAIVIYKLDRIGRSLRNLLEIIDFLKSQNIQLITVADNVDTTTPQGRLFFSISGAFAEYERELINERSSAGLQNARARGVVFGRPRKIVDVSEIKKKIAMGIPKSKVCKEYGIGRSTLYLKLGESK